MERERKSDRLAEKGEKIFRGAFETDPRLRKVYSRFDKECSREEAECEENVEDTFRKLSPEKQPGFIRKMRALLNKLETELEVQRSQGRREEKEEAARQVISSHPEEYILGITALFLGAAEDLEAPLMEDFLRDWENFLNREEEKERIARIAQVIVKVKEELGEDFPANQEGSKKEFFSGDFFEAGKECFWLAMLSAFTVGDFGSLAEEVVASDDAAALSLAYFACWQDDPTGGKLAEIFVEDWKRSAQAEEEMPGYSEGIQAALEAFLELLEEIREGI